MTILDTSIWIAFINKEDSCHNKAIKVFTALSPATIEIFDHIYTEILTVLRNRTNNAYCESFLRFLKNYRIGINLSTEEIFNKATYYFFQYPKLSFTDCLLMAATKISNAKLISFDKNLQKAWEKIKK